MSVRRGLDELLQEASSESSALSAMLATKRSWRRRSWSGDSVTSVRRLSPGGAQPAPSASAGTLHAVGLRVSPCTTSTGHGAWCRTSVETLPWIIRPRRPQPWAPMTTSRASRCGGGARRSRRRAARRARASRRRRRPRRARDFVAASTSATCSARPCAARPRSPP